MSGALPMQLGLVAPQDRHHQAGPERVQPDLSQALSASRILAPGLDRVIFSLHGVVTQSLARRVERRLGALSGVVEARVDDVADLLTLKLLRDHTSTAFIVAVLRDYALIAVPLAEGDPARVRREASHDARRLTAATSRSVVLVALAGVCSLIVSLDDLFNPQSRAIALNVQALLATAMLAWGARPTLTRAGRRLLDLRPTPDSLPLGVGLALYAASLGLFFTGGQPEFFASMLVITGAIVADRVGHSLRQRARAPLLAVRAAIDTDAVVVQPGGLYTVRPQDLAVGDTAIVRGPAVVPADGIVIQGEGVVVPPVFRAGGKDATSMPDDADGAIHDGPAPDGVEVSAGGNVVAGMTLTEGAIAVRITVDNPRSALARIADIVEVIGEHRALSSDGPTPSEVGRPSADQGWFEARAAWSVVAVTLFVLVAAIVAVAAEMAKTDGGGGVFGGAWGRGLAVLAAGAPLAAARLWDPTLLSTVGGALLQGILVRDLRAAYRLAKLRWLYVDRTGVLTAGAPQVEGWCLAPTLNRDRILGLVSALEQGQGHPVALALHGLATDLLRDVNAVPKVRDVETIRGRGLRGRTKDGSWVRLGGLGFIQDEGLALTVLPGGCPTPGDGDRSDPAVDASDCPHTVVYLAIDERIVARFHLYDPVRPDARRAVLSLRRHGLQLGMFTGDSLRSAGRASESTGIPVAIAGVSADRLEAFIAQRTAEDGDRVAAVTTASHVGRIRRAAGTSIVLGTGLAAGTYEDDIAVMPDDLNALATVIGFARKVRWRVGWATLSLAVYTMVASVAAGAGLLPLELACLTSLATTVSINMLTSRPVG